MTGADQRHETPVRSRPGRREGTDADGARTRLRVLEPVSERALRKRRQPGSAAVGLGRFVRKLPVTGAGQEGMGPMHKRFVVAVLAGALLLFGAPQYTFARSGGGGRGDHGRHERSEHSSRSYYGHPYSYYGYPNYYGGYGGYGGYDNGCSSDGGGYPTRGYNGGSYNGGSYNGGSYNGGSYNGGSYNGGCNNRGSYGPSYPDQGSWDCRSDPDRDRNRYHAPCRYYSECTNYPRCKD
jgi:hypothetical protein